MAANGDNQGPTPGPEHGPKLGIIAGGGRLPELLVRACRASGRDFFLALLAGNGDPARFPDTDHAAFRLGAAGKLIKRLHKENVVDLTFAGSVRRPSMADLVPDLWTTRFLARTKALGLGDDGLLRALIDTLETREGFHVVGPERIVPDLLAAPGPLGVVSPTEAQAEDALLGLSAARDLGRRDIGQAVVIRDGRVAAEEGADGTEAMLAGLTGDRAAGGVLVKASKPQQERRIDLPTIGPDTVRQAAEAGLAGIAVEAGQSFILDKDDVRALADGRGLFVVGVAPGAGDGS